METGIHRKENMIRDELDNTIYVQMFAHFRLSGMGKCLDEDDIRSDMLSKLLAYFVCYWKKELSVQELVDVFWENEKSDNPAGALKNLIYRLRTVLKKTWPDMEFILTGRSSYRWNPKIPLLIDAEEFDLLCKEAKQSQDMKERMETYIKAIGHYKGMFLPKISGEYWAISLSTYYHSLYLSAVKEAAALLEKEGEYAQMKQICSEALKLDMLDEGLHCLIIRSLEQQNKLKLAEERYKKAVDLLYENLGVSPSTELREAYEQLLKRTHSEEKSIRVIQNELNDDIEEGAFCCEYGVFKKTYHLEKRRAERFGISIYLSLITVVPTDENIKRDQKYLDIINEGMDKLKHTLMHSLRSSDIFSKYSGTQFIVMLPTCQYESAKMVMNRIEQVFLSIYKKKKVKLQFNLDEMESAAKVHKMEGED